MKKYLWLLILLSPFIIAGSIQQRQTGVILQYNAAGGIGACASTVKLKLTFDDTEADDSDSNHTLTAAGSLPTYEADLPGTVTGDTKSNFFDATGDWYTVADSADFDWDETNMTLGFFLKLDEVVSRHDDYIFLQKAGSNDFWHLRHHSTAGFQFLIKEGGTNEVTINTSTLVGDTNWHYVAVIKVGTEWGVYYDAGGDGTAEQIGFVSDADTADTAAVLVIGDGDGPTPGDDGDELEGNLNEVYLDHANYFSAAPVVGLSDTITVPTTEICN